MSGLISIHIIVKLEQTYLVPLFTLSAAKVKYQFDNEEEVQSEEDNDDDFKAFDAETGHVAENGANSSNGNISDDGSDFNISDDDSPKPKAAPKASSKKAPPKKKVTIE